MEEHNCCKRCGECCRVIWINETKKQIRERDDGTRDKQFILKHWHRISRVEAYKRHPALQKAYPVKETDWDGIYFYVCDAWDSDTGLCTLHDQRPAVCSGFPFYDGSPYKGKEGGIGKRWLRALGCGCAEQLED